MCAAAGLMPSSRYPSCAGVMVTHSIPGGGYANRPRSSRFANRHMPLKMSIMPSGVDPPPLKCSDLRYVFDIKEDCNGKEAIQA